MHIDELSTEVPRAKLEFFVNKPERVGEEKMG
jgi:hypothetical protein